MLSRTSTIPDDEANAAFWIFAYGSLIWRPGFPFLERLPARVDGWSRRLWQGSPDHRGTPDSPGRVVTLIPSPGQSCGGIAYRIAHSDRASVLAYLDHRESGGYQRTMLTVSFSDGSRPPCHALTYAAPPTNPHFLGEAPTAELAAQIARSVGPSGPNDQYVLELYSALVAIGCHDEHLHGVVTLLRTRIIEE